jgi:ubiquinone/menaquinone biosynthesis C-methylase UbiE
MSYTDQNTFFAQAYRTGTDHWTNIPFNRRPNELTLYLPKDALILDLGTGRGRLLYELADLDFRSIGLENNLDMVHRGNSEIKNKKLEREMRFIHGDALDIPLTDGSFDAVVDIGLLHHIKPEDYETYVSEAARVLKVGGLAYIVLLSKLSPNYFSWHPNKDEQSDYVREGVRYHFFSDEELYGLFGKKFEIMQLDHDMPYGPRDMVFSVLLLKKK